MCTYMYIHVHVSKRLYYHITMCILENTCTCIYIYSISQIQLCKSHIQHVHVYVVWGEHVFYWGNMPWSKKERPASWWQCAIKRRGAKKQRKNVQLWTDSAGKEQEKEQGERKGWGEKRNYSLKMWIIRARFLRESWATIESGTSPMARHTFYEIRQL